MLGASTKDNYAWNPSVDTICFGDCSVWMARMSAKKSHAISSRSINRQRHLERLRLVAIFILLAAFLFSGQLLVPFIISSLIEIS
jgi:hypothetical protein